MVRTVLKEEAALRGMTLTELSERLGLYLSNLSGMDGGKRSVSLKRLSRIARLLHCGVEDLIVSSEREQHLFGEKSLNKALERMEQSNEDGTDKSWVPKVMLSFNRHYARKRRRR